MPYRGSSQIISGIILVAFSVFIFSISFIPEGLFTQLSYIWIGLSFLIFPVIVFPALFGIYSIMWGYYIHTRPRATKLS